jgi:hypothetical protein
MQELTTSEISLMYGTYEGTDRIWREGSIRKLRRQRGAVQGGAWVKWTGTSGSRRGKGKNHGYKRALYPPSKSWRTPTYHPTSCEVISLSLTRHNLSFPLEKYLKRHLSLTTLRPSSPKMQLVKVVSLPPRACYL